MFAFSYSKLRPYEHWEATRAGAKDLWHQYQDFFKPTNVNKLALRYINRLSDLLFTLARLENDGGKADVTWTPGANR